MLIPLLLLNAVVTWLTYRGVESGMIRSRELKSHSSLTFDIPRLLDRMKVSPILTITAKDAQTFLRDWHFMFYKLMPGIVTPTLILMIVRYSVTQESASLPPEIARMIYIMFLITVLVLFLAQAYIFVGNIFGYDRVAVSNIFAAPISDREILLGKNLFMFALLTLDSLVISALSLLFFSNIIIPITLFIFLESMVIILIGLGNICSMIFPYYVPFDKPTVSFQGTLIVGIMNMATDLILGAIMIPVIVILFLSIRAENLLWIILALPVSLAYSFLIYGFLLRYASVLMPRYRESIYHNVTST